jgi:tRNA (guanine37-N1)-methyltransferase
MKIDAFTILPAAMQPYLETSIIGKAIESQLVQVQLHDIRKYATDRHRTTDDVAYGGGGGMIMKAEPIYSAVESVLGDELGSTSIILLTPQGQLLTHELAKEFSSLPRIALICGRYEGVDERVRSRLATHEISIGDYVITGGELPALVLIDAVVRLIPGVIGNEHATRDDSHSSGLLEYAHYTRPEIFRDMHVPPVLLSGNHTQIESWRERDSLLRTLRRRPDLLGRIDFSEAQIDLLKEIADQHGLAWSEVKKVLKTSDRGNT